MATTDSKYNSHTEPLLKSLNILKINDIFTIQCLKFFHNYINDRVPVFFRSFFVEHALYHDYETRHCHNICIPHSHTTKARKCIRYPVFCPGFQKGRVPSEKGTLAR